MYGHWSATRDATDALANMSAQLLSFDNAVAVAKEYVDQNPDTLLIVTADHETGGLEDGQWTSNGQHTASFVSVYAYGVGAEGLTEACLVDNTDIHDYIEESIENYGYREPVEEPDPIEGELGTIYFNKPIAKVHEVSGCAPS